MMAFLGCGLLATGCGGGERPELRLVAYDSFPTGDSDITRLLDEFGDSIGYDVTVLTAGDAGAMVSKATLTAGNPEGDVLWGVDSSLLGRALAGDVFEDYRSANGDALAPDIPDPAVTPVDFGDVCVNVDLAEFAAVSVDPPSSLDDLIDPLYRGMLVTQNAATSTPGLAFLLATIAEYGDPGWLDYWTRLRANDVRIVDGWTESYYEAFSRYGGDQPMVVSYGTSPPAEVLFSEPRPAEAPTAIVEATCYRQVEYAGILRGTGEREAAEQLIDFLTSIEFQSALPLSLFVYPANRGAELPAEFVDYSTRPDAAYDLDPGLIEENRARWIDQWSEIMGLGS